MSLTLDLFDLPAATDGRLALINHESALDRCWQIIETATDRTDTAAQLVDEEYRRSHFLGDTEALDRLLVLSATMREQQPDLADTYLLAAQVASLVHHFEPAKAYLLKAQALNADTDLLLRQRLALEQATGENWPQVLTHRQSLSKLRPSIQNLVPLGALYAEMGRFADAQEAYFTALRRDTEHSPFALAWVCFQLGVLFGETIPETDAPQAKYWYEQALAYIPAYTHARVHLAEMHLEANAFTSAENLLVPIKHSEDPEVSWRLAQTYARQGKLGEAAQQLVRTSQTFDSLLLRHELAFADHAVAFYLAEGQEPQRALTLALKNLANRATLRAFELAHETALATESLALAKELAEHAAKKWGHLPAFADSALKPSLEASPLSFVKFC